MPMLLNISAAVFEFSMTGMFMFPSCSGHAERYCCTINSHRTGILNSTAWSSHVDILNMTAALFNVI